MSILLFTQISFSQTNSKDSAFIKRQDSLPHATFYFYRSFVPLIMKSVKKIPIYVNDSLVHNLKARAVAVRCIPVPYDGWHYRSEDG